MNIKDCFDAFGRPDQDKLIEFFKLRGENYTNEHIKDIDYLINKIAQNMFRFENNIETAKSDYLDLISLLLKKGVIYDTTTES